jgi:hypothetical protein
VVKRNSAPESILRNGALTANVAYIAVLLVAASNTYVQGHRPARGPNADWAAFDAVFMTLLAVSIAAYAACHAIATASFWKDGLTRWVLWMTLPLAVILLLAWLVAQRSDAPGWQVFAMALLAAALTALAARRPVYSAP